eukprot:TRINITY_DN105633_c0_g1_i1.p1 TRINITY_DN105633_c0_g1~~TRINITY_DN105633_c0_g1_i1.p1  ORF type:complete len:492 (-),score=139.77 TRINITY_DN105633_c0_g1_i1:41-1483(-)
MAERSSRSLQGSGQQMMRAMTPRGDATASMAQTPRSAREGGGGQWQSTALSGQARASSSQPGRKIKDMSIEEMEEQLHPRMHKKPVVAMPGRSGGPPISARELLEENKLLIQIKKDQKAMKRQNSREFVQRLLEEDRMKSEGLKATDLGKKSALKELAQDYKARIAQNELSKADALRAERSTPGANYFPFVEGENIVKGREQKSAKLREEMRGFLTKQREEHPPRNDSLIQDTKQNHKLLYNLGPKDFAATAPSFTASDRPASPSKGSEQLKLVDEPSAHMARHPVFLTKAKEHMSRRLTDGHVRKALEQKVEETKHELMQMSEQRQGEVQRLEDSLLVADALRYDSGAAKADERRRHAQFLREQISQGREKKQQEKAFWRSECAGYWGPEDKAPVDVGAHRAHCSDLIKQMEVDHNRKLLDRDRRLKVERKMIDNCLVQMEADRAVEMQKHVQQRQVLVTTWQSQQKIKEAMKTIDGIS